MPATALARITAKAGANIHRLTVNWEEVEPQRDIVSEAGWDRYEAIAKAFRARGQRLLITLSPAPAWARDPGLAQLCPFGPTCTFPPSERMLGEWAEYVAEVVRRLPDAVIETWNEPNIDYFWKPYSQPRRFARLHEATYRAAKSVDPKTTVLAGGLAGTVSSLDRRRMTARRFLAEAYATGRLDDTVDALSIHLYTKNERSMGAGTLFAQSLGDIRRVRNQNSDGLKQIWVTETGLSTSGDWALSAKQQADGLIRRYRRLMTMGDVGGVIFHTALDQRERVRSDRGFGFGVVANHSPLEVKPAYCEFAGRASNDPPGGCTRINDTLPGGLTSGNPLLDFIVSIAPKKAKTKAKRRCARWTEDEELSARLGGQANATDPAMRRYVPGGSPRPPPGAEPVGSPGAE